jgi:hypothetical protein
MTRNFLLARRGRADLGSRLVYLERIVPRFDGGCSFKIEEEKQLLIASRGHFGENDRSSNVTSVLVEPQFGTGRLEKG